MRCSIISISIYFSWSHNPRQTAYEVAVSKLLCVQCSGSPGQPGQWFAQCWFQGHVDQFDWSNQISLSTVTNFWLSIASGLDCQNILNKLIQICFVTASPKVNKQHGVSVAWVKHGGIANAFGPQPRSSVAERCWINGQQEKKHCFPSG